MNNKKESLLLRRLLRFWRQPWIRTGAFFVGIVTWGFLIYANTLASTFHFDDWFFIIKNEGIRNLGNLTTAGQGVLGHFSRFLTFYTFAVDYHFYELNPDGYRLTNIAIHIVNALLVGWLTSLVVSIIHPQQDGKSRYPGQIAFLTTIIFLTHPLQTQAVTYISQRFTSLATLFYFLSSALYLKGRMREKNDSETVVFFSGAFIAGVLGMCCKELVVTLPVMILFFEWFLFGARFKWGRTDHKLRLGSFLFILLGMSLIIPAFFSFNIKNMLFGAITSGSHQGDILTGGTYLLTQIRVVVMLLRLYFFPIGQNLFYDFPMSWHLWEPTIVFSFVIVVAVIVWAIKQRRHRQLVSFGVFWFFISYMDNLVPRAHVIWEHKLYLPSFGLCLVVSSLLTESVKKIQGVRFLVFGLILILSGGTFYRNKIWKNEIVLWQDVVRKSPKLAKANYGLGLAYYRDGQYEPAMQYLNRAIILNSAYFDAYISRGVIFGYQGRFDLAMKNFNTALQIRPMNYEASLNRGKLYFLVGNYQAAIEDFSRAISKDPKEVAAYVLRASAYVKTKQVGLANADFEKAETLKVVK